MYNHSYSNHMEGKTIMSDALENAVQPKAWYAELPRKQYSTLNKVNISNTWFDVYLLDNDIYAIYEPRHFQEVISYLVIGSDGALVIDTGMGIGDFKSVIDELYDGNITVVNTHTHFDHIGGNYQFPLVHVLNNHVATERLRRGLSNDMVKENMVDDSTVLPYPDGFDPNTYHIRPCKFETINPGHVFDLGNRKIKVISTPGHSPDSIMLYEESKKILFTGDTYYPATLYAHLSSSDGMTSAIEIYRDTMKSIASKFSDYTVLASHNEPISNGSVLTDVANALTDICENKLDFEVDSFGLKKYTFNGFCIVAN